MLMAFDIETAADATVIPWLEPLEAPGNLKDPAKIAEAIRARKQKRLDDMALDCDYNRIVAIGRTTDDAGTVTVDVCRDTQDEAAVLAAFWGEWETPGAVKVGFRCVPFDVPTLVQRSRILGVSLPRIEQRKYGSADFHDLNLILTHGGLTFGHSLAFYCRRFGLDVPADDTTGADIAGMVERGDWDGITAHCVADVAKTWALAKRLMKGL